MTCMPWRVLNKDMDFVCTFEMEYGRMVDFSRIIAFDPHLPNEKQYTCHNSQSQKETEVLIV